MNGVVHEHVIGYLHRVTDDGRRLMKVTLDREKVPILQGDSVIGYCNWIYSDENMLWARTDVNIDDQEVLSMDLNITQAIHRHHPIPAVPPHDPPAYNVIEIGGDLIALHIIPRSQWAYKEFA